MIISNAVLHYKDEIICLEERNIYFQKPVSLQLVFFYFYSWFSELHALYSTTATF